MLKKLISPLFATSSLAALIFIFALAAGLTLSDDAEAVTYGSMPEISTGAPLPSRVPAHLEAEFWQCEERHSVRVGGDGEDVFCRIPYTEAWTGRSWPGCWIQDGPEFIASDSYGRFTHLPNCRELFGSPAEFPAVRHRPIIGCDIIGMVGAKDWSRCECPSDRVNLRAEGESGTKRCLTDVEMEWADACKENGWKISEERNNDFRGDEVVKSYYVSAFFCDFPQLMVVADGNYDGCVLYGPGDETARSGRPLCGEMDFDNPVPADEAAQAAAEAAVILAAALAESRRLPDGVAKEREREYHDCREYHEVLIAYGPTRREYDRPVKDTACRINFVDELSGRRWNGCWITDAKTTSSSKFTGPGIRDGEAPFCHRVFEEGLPRAGGGVFAANCNRAGKVYSRNMRSCECPPDRSTLLAGGEEGTERCVSAEEAEYAALCAENGWTVSESAHLTETGTGKRFNIVEHFNSLAWEGDRRPDEALITRYNSAFFCDFRVRATATDAIYDGCLLYGPGEETDRAGLPYCGDVDVFGANAATAKYVYDCGGVKRRQGGECVCPSTAPETFNWGGEEFCVRTNAKAVLDACKGGGVSIQNISRTNPPALACLISLDG